jgi:hypothetical protein
MYILMNGTGVWPAIWMLSTDEKHGGWPGNGKIDIMEYVGWKPGVVHGTVHTEAYNGMKGTQKEGKTRTNNEPHGVLVVRQRTIIFAPTELLHLLEGANDANTETGTSADRDTAPTSFTTKD